ncbi:ABC transporter permease [Lacibacterium aquatile]|uniref:ABC transporter permease n=1 Tax=Lacibacterium aquatile TaxID=1168082 RepID=A0ABW5DN71_9PROT
MSSFLLRRLSSLILTLAVTSLAIFLVMEVLPGDPAAIMLGLEARPDTLAALRTELGLDRGLFERYFSWVGGLLTGDFGVSYTYRVPVGQLIGERMVVTVPLALMAICVAAGIGVPLGVLAASARGKLTDQAATAFSQLGIAVPNFWIGLVLILVFALSLGWFPAGSFPGWSSSIPGALQALVLPAIALGLPQAAILTRVTRSSVLEVLTEDFIRTARAKGLSRRTVLRRHALRNALIPVITILGLQLATLIGGTILIENVFALAGLGRLIYQAMTQRDLIVVESVAMLMAALVITVNFLVDLAYGWLDPRLRAGR